MHVPAQVAAEQLPASSAEVRLPAHSLLEHEAHHAVEMAFAVIDEDTGQVPAFVHELNSGTLALESTSTVLEPFAVAPGARGPVEDDSSVPAPSPPATKLTPPGRAYLPDQRIVTFDDLAREVAAYLEGSSGLTGVALWRPGEGLIFGHNADELFPLASVIKVHLMLTYLDAVDAEDREPSAYEAKMLDWMITRSDNDSAAVLWSLLGGGRVAAYLRSHGLEPLPTIDDSDTTVESPRDLALLFARLYAGDLLSPKMTRYALSLLGRIDPSQIWGVTAGLVELPQPPRVYMKDGWSPGGRRLAD